MINVGNGVIEKLPRNSELHIKADGFVLLALKKPNGDLKHIAFSRGNNYLRYQTGKALKNLHVLTQGKDGQPQTTWFYEIVKRRIIPILSPKKIEVAPELLEEDHLQDRIARAAAAAIAAKYGRESIEYETFEEWSQEIDLDDDETTPMSPHEVRSQEMLMAQAAAQLKAQQQQTQQKPTEEAPKPAETPKPEEPKPAET